MGHIDRGATPRPGRARAAAAAAAVLLAATGAGTASAQAPQPDTCANANVRAQQVGGPLLPGCRAYELVTPQDTGHQIVQRRTVNAAGDQITWATYGPIPGSPVGVPGELRTTRTPEGWRSEVELSPFVSTRPSTINDKQQPVFVDPENPGRRTFQSTFPFFAGDVSGTRTGPLVSNDLMGREADGSLTWLSAPASGTTGATENVQHTMLFASPDLSRTLIQSNRGMTPEVPANGRIHLYLTQRGKPTQLVTVAPGAPGSTTPLLNYRQSGSVQVTLASEDLDTIVFQQTGTDALFARLHAADPARAQTIEITAGPNGGTCGPNADPLALARDGAKVAFRCNQPADGTTGPTRSYFYVRDLRIADVDAPGAFVEVPSFPSAKNFTTDGLERAIDQSGQLVTVGGTTRPLLPAGLRSSWQLRMSRDGRFISAMSPSIPGGDLGGTEQVVLIDTDEPDPDAATTCVSCPADGSVPTASSTTGDFTNGVNPIARFGQGSGVMGQDGDYVIFQTAQALVPRDTNGQVDVYEWTKDGGHRLLSSGTSPKPTELIDASQDGATVFLLTHDALVPQDDDGGQQDIYAVRAGGGFLAPDAPPAECATDCQPAGPPAPPAVAAPTELLRGVNGNVAQERTPSVRLTLAGTRIVRGTTQGAVKAKVTGAGLLTVSGTGVRSESRAARKAGTYTLTVRLSEATKRTLRRTGKASIAVTVRYQPLAGATKALRRTLEFRVAKTKTKTKKGGR